MFKKYFLTLTAVCLSHLILTQKDSNPKNLPSNNLVKNHFPNAYAWYLSISEKYPDAKLNTIEFCISDHHHAKNHTIYFPQSSIEFIENWHDIYCKSDEIIKKLAEEEYLLLHEAAHALNYDYQKGEFAKIMAIFIGASSLLHTINQSLSKTITPQETIIKSVVIIAALATGIFSYARLQEKNADHFANQNADQQALQAGISWHLQNKKDLDIPENYSNIKKLIFEQISDLAHPRPTKRQERAQSIYNQRFQAIN